MDEEFRIDVQRALAEFRASAEDSITFPSTLSAAERAFVHYSCSQLGLVSKSHGKGEARQLRVTRRVVVRSTAARAPEILLHPHAEAAVREYFATFPATPSDWRVSEDIHALAVEAFGRWLYARDAAAPAAGRGRASGVDAASWHAFRARREGHPDVARVTAARKLLPAWGVRDVVCDACATSSVVIVCGDTGCGKSTQVPQFLIDNVRDEAGAGVRMIVTQPRRISAITLCERVSYEMCDDVGRMCGYNVRLESAVTEDTRVTYVTTGVLLRRLMTDPNLKGITHVVLDEVHERDINTDVLLLILRDLLCTRKDLTLILMSATLQLDLFMNYFRQTAHERGVAVSPIPTSEAIASAMRSRTGAQGRAFLSPDVSLVYIDGSTFPVTRLYLEDILTHTAFMTPGGTGYARAKANTRLQKLQQEREHGVATAAPRTAPSSKQAQSADVTAAAAPAPSVAKVSSAAVTAPRSFDDIGRPQAAEFTCPTCSHVGFSSVEDFGEHTVTCTGDPPAAPAPPRTHAAPPPAAHISKHANGVPKNLDAIGAVRAEELVCVTCRLSTFSSLDDYAVHIVLCDGSQALEATTPSAAADAADSPAIEDADAGGGVRGIALPGGRRAKAAAPVEDVTDVDIMLDEYQLCVNDEDVDVELLIHLLAYIYEHTFARAQTPSLAHVHGPRSLASVGAGAALVFLPGWDEISRVSEVARSHATLGNSARVHIHPLHSGIPTHEQRRVFVRAPPGVFKIILATNIAETSITVSDVVYVIDAGRVRERTYDAYTSCVSLNSVWISRASAAQRAGRAGRVTAGVCFHVYSRKRHAAMREYTVPEMLRTPLDELCLTLKMCVRNMGEYARKAASAVGTSRSASATEAAAAGNKSKRVSDCVSDVEVFLRRCVQPPEAQSVRAAVRTLHELGALTHTHAHAPTVSHVCEDTLTPLGVRLAQIPISPRMGKMILYSILFKCLGSVLTIACAQSYKSPYVLPMHPGEKRAADDAKRNLTRGARSDHIALLYAYEGFHAARARGGGSPGNAVEVAWCRENYISGACMNMVTAMREQILTELVNCGALGRTFRHERGRRVDTRAALATVSVNDANIPLVLAVVCVGAYPHVARSMPAGVARDSGTLRTQIETRGHTSGKVQIHASSVCGGRGPPGTLAGASPHACEWLTYEEMSSVGTYGSVALKGISVCAPTCVMLLCGPHTHLYNAYTREYDADEDDDGDVHERSRVSEYESALGHFVRGVAHATPFLRLTDLERSLTHALGRVGDGAEGDETGDDAMDPDVFVDSWIRFRMEPRVAVPLLVLRARLARAFHRCVLMYEAATELATQGRVPPAFADEDEQCVRLCAEVICYETTGKGLDARARLGMMAHAAPGVTGPPRGGAARGGGRGGGRGGLAPGAVHLAAAASAAVAPPLRAAPSAARPPQARAAVAPAPVAARPPSIGSAQAQPASTPPGNPTTASPLEALFQRAAAVATPAPRPHAASAPVPSRTVADTMPPPPPLPNEGDWMSFGGAAGAAEGSVDASMTHSKVLAATQKKAKKKGGISASTTTSASVGAAAAAAAVQSPPAAGRGGAGRKKASGPGAAFHAPT